jgi:molybdenum cofactor synthesis domain-containing protein
VTQAQITKPLTEQPMTTEPLKAAILLIGDELLSGKVRDDNGAHLIQTLRGLGADVTELHMVSDRVPRIVEALTLVRHRNDVVFSCGGVGPTHDDRTHEAVAAAWGVPLAEHPEMAALLRATYGDAAPRWMKIAQMPQGCELITHTPGGWPCCRMGNLYILPGSPPYVTAHLRGLAPLLVRAAAPIALTTFDLHLDEGALAPLLAEVEARFAPVQVGSYPVIEPSPYRVRVTLEARDRALTLSAAAWLRQRLQPEDIYAATRPGEPAP